MSKNGWTDLLQGKKAANTDIVGELTLGLKKEAVIETNHIQASYKREYVAFNSFLVRQFWAKFTSDPDVSYLSWTYKHFSSGGKLHKFDLKIIVVWSAWIKLN